MSSSGVKSIDEYKGHVIKELTQGAHIVENADGERVGAYPTRQEAETAIDDKDKPAANQN